MVFRIINKSFRKRTIWDNILAFILVVFLFFFCFSVPFLPLSSFPIPLSPFSLPPFLFLLFSWVTTDTEASPWEVQTRGVTSSLYCYCYCFVLLLYCYCLGARVTDTLDSSCFSFKYRKQRKCFSLRTCLKGLETLNLATYKYICLLEKSLLSYQEV